MSLKQWLDNGWLRRHETSRQEIQEQFEGVAGDIDDASQDLSAAWKFAIAYNAALRLCSIMLYACGYRSSREQKHYRTITSLPLTLGPEAAELTNYLDRCRVKRHEATYEKASIVSLDEAEELITAVNGLKLQVHHWLKANHPDYA